MSSGLFCGAITPRLGPRFVYKRAICLAVI